MIPIVVGLFGLVIGSFLNVVIHRVPLGQSLMWPLSRCPACGVGIAAWDNVPVISYLPCVGDAGTARRASRPAIPLSRH